MSDTRKPTYDELVALVAEQAEAIALLRDENAFLRGELEKLRKDPPSGIARAVPSFVKPNRAPREKKERKKRSQSFSRRREKPTETQDHAVDQCPDCGHKLSGGHVHRVRQVIEIPVAPVRIISHRVFGRFCGRCRKRWIATLDLTGQVVGRHRVGVRLMSLIVLLKNGCRMTVEAIQKLLRSLYALHLSRGEICEILHTAARCGQQAYEGLKEAVRGSPYVHADETSWREDGKNHWLWSFSTPAARLYVEDPSRGHQVSERILGERYSGILCSDFLGAYNYHLGVHQRCWVHFLRDLKELAEKHSEDVSVLRWTKRVRKVYEDAKKFRDLNVTDRRQRIRARERFQDRLLALAKPYFRTDAPQKTLAERIYNFSQDLFTFVEHPEVPSDNNPAERAIRPAVVYRKMSGGTRSQQGSATASILMSLLGTWQINGTDPMTACQQMLSAKA
jgi:transposase